MDKVQRIASLSITGVRKSCPQAALDTMLCLTRFDLYVKQSATRSAICLRESGCLKQRSIGHSRILNVVIPEGRYGQKGLLMFTDGSKLCGCTGAEVFCK